MSDPREPTPGDLDVVERSCLYLWNMVLDESVAQLGPTPRDPKDLGQLASLIMTLIMCKQVFVQADVLHEVLCSRPWSAPFWEGSRGSLRPVYGRAREKLAGTLYELMGEGFYGFYLRATREQRADHDRKRELRIERLKKAARLRRRATEEA